jgi:hypothetical protein
MNTLEGTVVIVQYPGKEFRKNSFLMSSNGIEPTVQAPFNAVIPENVSGSSSW